MTPIPISEFADRINDILPVMMKEFTKRQTNELLKGKITLPQFIILGVLEHQGKSRMTDLAHDMDVTTAAMTGIVDRLVKAKYAQRTFDLKDRRIIFITLSKRGLELIRRIHGQRRRMIMDIFGKISEKERESYLNILTHIRDILLEQKADAK